jgi:hypothetical protein
MIPYVPKNWNTNKGKYVNNSLVGFGCLPYVAEYVIIYVMKTLIINDLNLLGDRDN